jgi:hypothetical protein
VAWEANAENSLVRVQGLWVRDQVRSWELLGMCLYKEAVGKEHFRSVDFNTSLLFEFHGDFEMSR